MLLLKNATYIDWETLEFTQADILVEEGPDGGIQLNPAAEILHAGNKKPEIHDCSGAYVTKSFAVGHHHVYSALARGMGAPAKNPANFREILKYIWWALDQSLDREMIEASALATAMAAAKAGSTFVIDHHASPNLISGSLDIIAKAFERVGVGHLLSYEITDRYGKEKAAAALDETRRFLEENQGLVGLHASFTVGDDTMGAATELIRQTGSGAHIHVAEDVYDQQHCFSTHQKSVVQRLLDFGITENPKSLLIHCLHLKHDEKEMLRDAPAWIVENIESNLNNGVGHFNGKDIGGRIFLGTDGMHSDMLRSAQFAFFAGREHDNIDFEIAYRRFRNVHRYLSQNQFSGDGPNNLVVLDYNSPTAFKPENFLGHFLFGLNATHVRDVISKGKIIVKDRRLQTVDEKEILEFTREQSQRLWSRMKKVKIK